MNECSERREKQVHEVDGDFYNQEEDTQDADDQVEVRQADIQSVGIRWNSCGKTYKLDHTMGAV